MQAYKIEAAIGKDGSLTLDDLPFAKGEPVEIIILSRATQLADADADANAKNFALRGIAVQYQQPFDSVAENDWDSLQ